MYCVCVYDSCVCIHYVVRCVLCFMWEVLNCHSRYRYSFNSHVRPLSLSVSHTHVLCISLLPTHSHTHQTHPLSSLAREDCPSPAAPESTTRTVSAPPTKHPPRRRGCGPTHDDHTHQSPSFANSAPIGAGGGSKDGVAGGNRTTATISSSSPSPAEILGRCDLGC